MESKSNPFFIKPPRTIKNVYIRSIALIVTTCIVLPLVCAVIMLVALLQGFNMMLAELNSNIKDGWTEVRELMAKHWKSAKVMMDKKFVAKEK